MPQFMISDEHGFYLHRDNCGNYIPVKNKTLGDIWEQRKKASNVLINCVSKNLRDRYIVVEVEDEIIPRQKETITSKNDVIKQIGDEPIEESHIPSLLAKIDNFTEFIKNAEKHKEALIVSLSDVDKEISDINHYIEFGKFNAYQGWLAFKMLRGRLKKRRKIKDELHILTQLSECKVNSAMFTNIKTLIDKLNTREYQPRKLNQLFE